LLSVFGPKPVSNCQICFVYRKEKSLVSRGVRITPPKILVIGTANGGDKLRPANELVKLSASPS
jgi:hypothetical protein